MHIILKKFEVNDITLKLCNLTLKLCNLGIDKKTIECYNLCGKMWLISGQVQNVAKPAAGKTLSNVQVIARFYDINGNNVGGLQQVPVSPATLK
jgi:hypothetical protein